MKKKWLFMAALLLAVAGISGSLLHSAFASSGTGAGNNATQVAGQEQSDGDGEVADDQEKSDGDGEVADDQEQSDGDGEADDEKESADLAKQAKITGQQAADTALAQIKGTVQATDLEEENGAIVYSVEITDGGKAVAEVKVDAVTGKVVKIEKAGEADEDNSEDNGADGETADE